MEKHFVSNRTEAIALTKIMMRSHNKVKRLTSPLIKEISTQCGCGETAAVTLCAKVNGKWEYKSVGICKNCANS